tara:strand:- start:169 stop:588 length:420 start_codon:yes stop_codon:yes gene_type:complete
MKDLVYTPISKTYKKKGDPDSRKDFEEQEKLTKQGNTWMWDADRKNKAKIGDIFAFTKYKDKIQFHIINQVFDPSQRIESWRDNVGQQNRNVLYLSEPICTMTWEDWISLNGAKRIMGTTVATRNKSSEILEYVSKHVE